MKILVQTKMWRIAFVTSLVIGVSLLLWVRVQAPTVTAFQPTSYDPATYGLPDKIAGYDVLAAVPIESQMCAESGSMIILVVQSPRTALDEDEQKMITQNAVLETLRQMDIGTDILPEVVGSTITREKVRADYAYREKYWKEGGSGCAISGLGILLRGAMTSTPTIEMIIASPTPS